MSVLTKAALFSSRRKLEAVDVEGYPTVHFKVLTRSQIKNAIDKGEAKDKETNTTGNQGCFLLAASICDADGKLLFAHGEEAEVGEIEYPLFREVNKRFNEVHFPEPTAQQLAVDAKNS